MSFIVFCPVTVPKLGLCHRSPVWSVPAASCGLPPRCDPVCPGRTCTQISPRASSCTRGLRTSPPHCKGTENKRAGKLLKSTRHRRFRMTSEHFQASLTHDGAKRLTPGCSAKSAIAMQAVSIKHSTIVANEFVGRRTAQQYQQHRNAGTDHTSHKEKDAVCHSNDKTSKSIWEPTFKYTAYYRPKCNSDVLQQTEKAASISTYMSKMTSVGTLLNANWYEAQAASRNTNVMIVLGSTSSPRSHAVRVASSATSISLELESPFTNIINTAAMLKETACPTVPTISHLR